MKPHIKSAALSALKWSAFLSIIYIIIPIIMNLFTGYRDDIGTFIALRVIVTLYGLFPVLFISMWIWGIFSKKASITKINTNSKKTRNIEQILSTTPSQEPLATSPCKDIERNNSTVHCEPTIGKNHVNEVKLLTQRDYIKKYMTSEEQLNKAVSSGIVRAEIVNSILYIEDVPISRGIFKLRQEQYIKKYCITEQQFKEKLSSGSVKHKDFNGILFVEDLSPYAA